ncbi:unannotated protein [freshwater metagenome]|uniref:Unannotated protein n=1 Tax=freshwater metagenome TaxID=449393 RepID=A0A6J7I3U3_9ZZZZ|nr:hypothetical protein [Actinomycetota bacterium]
MTGNLVGVLGAVRTGQSWVEEVAEGWTCVEPVCSWSFNGLATANTTVASSRLMVV